MTLCHCHHSYVLDAPRSVSRSNLPEIEADGATSAPPAGGSRGRRPRGLDLVPVYSSGRSRQDYEPAPSARTRSPSESTESRLARGWTRGSPASPAPPSRAGQNTSRSPRSPAPVTSTPARCARRTTPAPTRGLRSVPRPADRGTATTRTQHERRRRCESGRRRTRSTTESNRATGRTSAGSPSSVDSAPATGGGCASDSTTAAPTAGTSRNSSPWSTSSRSPEEGRTGSATSLLPASPAIWRNKTVLRWSGSSGD